MAEEKLDLKKVEKRYYSGKNGHWERLTIPRMQYLCVEGQGAPGGPDYVDAMQRLYPVAYGVKFASKAAGRDFTVPPQNSLWWADDSSVFKEGRRDEWRWKAMIRMPDWITEAQVGAAQAVKGVEGVSLVALEEGDCFQCLHIGSYADEAPVLAQLHDEVMPQAGVTFNGPHHEIYLSDPRRVAPEKLRTILRQPVCNLKA